MRSESLSIPFWSAEEIGAAIKPALEQIAARKVLAYPTETVYGFGGGIDRESVDALVRLKSRPSGKPFLLLISGPDMIERLDLRLPAYAANLVTRHWPGPLTLVLAGGERRVPDRLRGPEGGIAVRWTSANRPGVPPAMRAAEILSQWGDAVTRGELRVLDGGALKPSKPSTVIDCMGRLPRVIRPGAISAATLRESVPNLIGDA
jgi:L-threonylcarbamoyladenylate synthase